MQTSSAGKSLATRAPQTDEYVVPFSEIDHTWLPLVGGKGANLGEMAAAGLPVPHGFCVTTRAYSEVTALPEMEAVLTELHGTAPSAERITAIAARARAAITGAPIPSSIAGAIRVAYLALGQDGQAVAVAVRSSATAEDLPDASFAGQQDTYLNVVGADAVIDAVRRCWASLWTDRAVSYRVANQVDHHGVALSAVVQQMVMSHVSGVLFTAHPLTGRRQMAVIEAVPGLGEALVSGQADPDHFEVDLATMHITERRLGEKQVAIRPRPGGGVAREEAAAGNRATASACLTDEQSIEIARLGQRVEQHYGSPQDIEWGVDAESRLWLLQARPITTLFPALDRVPADHQLHVYLSVNVAQGVYQPLTPLGIDFFRRFGTAAATLLGYQVDAGRGPEVLAVAAGRLFVDVSPILRTPLGRRLLLTVFGAMEARTVEAVRAVLNDPRMPAAITPPRLLTARWMIRLARETGIPKGALRAFRNPAEARIRVVTSAQALLAKAAEPVHSDTEALDRAECLASRMLPDIMFPLIPVAMVAGVGSFTLLRRIASRMGAENDALLVSRGLPHNVTTGMNLELWAIAQRLRQNAKAYKAISQTPPETLARRYRDGWLPDQVQHELAEFLAVYGVRGIAEIDTGVSRWAEDPTHIFGVLANYLRLDDPDKAPDVQFKRAQAEAEAATRRLQAMARRRGLFGPALASLLRLLTKRTRELAGVRESPKFFAVSLMARIQALMRQVGESLVVAGRLRRADDVFFLTFAEARAAVGGADQRTLVTERRSEYQREMKRKRIPRLLLSDGTMIFGEPMTATSGSNLAGSPASPGIYTGIARVILDPSGARLNPGEVLVAPSTDPGWTPLFLTAGALVMEMGGMMSHGSIVAREYGIPAVVGVLGATTTIRNGQRITVDGERGRISIETGEETSADSDGSRAREET